MAYQIGQAGTLANQRTQHTDQTGSPIESGHKESYSTGNGQSGQTGQRICPQKEAETMNIKEYAEGKGVSRGAIYKALTRTGHSAKELTDRKGNITPKGHAILRKIYPDDQELPSEPLNAPETEDSTLDDLRTRLSEAERAREKAEAALENETRQRELYTKLYAEAKEELRQQRETAEKERQSFLEKISEANRLISQQQELARLASMNPIRRLFSGKKKQSADSQGTVI